MRVEAALEIKLTIYFASRPCASGSLYESEDLFVPNRIPY